MSTELDTFRSSAASLRDNLRKALDDGAAGRAAEGYSVYTDLLESVHFARVRVETELGLSPGASSSILPMGRYGREWHLLWRDLHDVGGAITSSSQARVWIEGVVWIFEMARRFRDLESIEGVRSAFELVQSLWRGELEKRPQESRVDRFDAIALRLGEFVSRRRVRNTNPAFDAGIYLEVARTFTHFTKAAHDADRQDVAELSLRYFSSTADYNDVNTGNSPVLNASILALYAWTLFKVERMRVSLDAVRPWQALLEQRLTGSDLWVALRAASDETVAHGVGWDWWELGDMHGPSSAGVLVFPDYLLYAALVLSDTADLLVPRAPSEEDYSLAVRLRGAIETFEGSSAQERLGALPSQAYLRNELDRLIETYAEERERRVAEMELDPARILRFYLELERRLETAHSERVTRMLASPGTGDCEEFGYRGLQPKWYFADTHVHAEPEDLAEQLVDGLVQGEEDQLVDALLAAVPAPRPIALDQLRHELPRWMTEDGSDQSVIVTNSWQAATTLAPTEAESMDPSARGTRVTGKGTKVFRVYDSRPPYVAMFQTPSGLQILRDSVVAEEESDAVLGGGMALSGVRLLTSSEIDDLRTSQPELDDLRVRRQVLVTLTEKFAVRMIDTSRVEVRSLPSDAW
jgi:hypothetical protein